MKQSLSNHAKEAIRQALVKEYIRYNPKLREQDIVMTTQNGHLILVPLTYISQNKRRLKDYLQSIQHTNQLFISLPIHYDPYWEDSVVSSDHSKQLVDNLHSSNFNAFNTVQWQEEQLFLSKALDRCALTTVRLHQSKERLQKSRKEKETSDQTNLNSSVLRFIKLAIDQLLRLQILYQKESHLGDLFSKHSMKILKIHFPKIQHDAESPHFSNLLLEYAQTKDPSVFSTKERLDQISHLNTNALIRTRNLLQKRLQEMKEQLMGRRDKYEKIWHTVSQIENQVEQNHNHGLQTNETSDLIIPSRENQPPEPASPQPIPSWKIQIKKKDPSKD